MGYLRRGKWTRDEMFVSGRGECVCEAIGPPSMFRLIRRAVVLGEDDANFRFDLGTESSAVETELVLVVLCMLKSPAHDLMCVLMGKKKFHGFGNQFGWPLHKCEGSGIDGRDGTNGASERIYLGTLRGDVARRCARCGGILK